MESDSQGVVLSLAVSQFHETALDERFERIGTYTLTYGGSYQVNAKDPMLPRAR